MKGPPAPTLLEIARSFGTPAYAYDLGAIRRSVGRLQTYLPREIDLRYSLKANPSLGLCGLIASLGLGAEVASEGELVTALEAGFPPGRILASGPYKPPSMLDRLARLPGSLVSIDSVSELETMAQDRSGAVLLRLRPDFDSLAAVGTGSDSRFGIIQDDLPRCRALLAEGRIRCAGFHVFCGSQVLETEHLRRHVRESTELALRSADALGIDPDVCDLGGGFGVPYGDEPELDLRSVGHALEEAARRLAPARLLVELGRYVVAQAGWYLATVVGRQTWRGRNAVVVNGGTHQRADACCLGLRTASRPPLVLRDPGAGCGERAVTDVLGCLSAPGDVLAEEASLPPLEMGDVLAFPNAGAYGFSASPVYFHCQPPPAEIAFDGGEIHVLRPALPVRGLLEGQLPLAPGRPPAVPEESALSRRSNR